MLGARSREVLGALESGWGPPLVGGPGTRGRHLPPWVLVHLPVDGSDGPGLAELTLPRVLATQSDGHLARGPRAPRSVACGRLGVSLPRVQLPASTRANLGQPWCLGPSAGLLPSQWSGWELPKAGMELEGCSSLGSREGSVSGRRGLCGPRRGPAPWERWGCCTARHLGAGSPCFSSVLKPTLGKRGGLKPALGRWGGLKPARGRRGGLGWGVTSWVRMGLNLNRNERPVRP